MRTGQAARCDAALSVTPRHSLRDPETLRSFVQNIQEGIYITNVRGEILDANPAFLAMLGVSSLEELRNYTAAALHVDPRQRQRELELLARDGRIREFELQLLRPDGAITTVLDTTYALRDAASGEIFYHGILIDITARKALEEQLLEQSLRDPLTGCWNRRYLGELRRALDERGVESWGCLYIDIDHFKQLNDEQGHESGDEVLARMARFLLRQVRADEAVLRIGGDEFVIVLGGADAARTESVARRLQLAALRTAPVAFSLGWASRTGDEPLERTISRADHELLAVRVVERSPSRREDDFGL